MRLGRVIGRIWATAKDAKIVGIKMAILEPLDEKQTVIGHPFLAADLLNCRDGDIVFWVGGAEATFPLPDRQIPSDASIVGLVDHIQS